MPIGLHPVAEQMIAKPVLVSWTVTCPGCRAQVRLIRSPVEGEWICPCCASTQPARTIRYLHAYRNDPGRTWEGVRPLDLIRAVTAP